MPVLHFAQCYDIDPCMPHTCTHLMMVATTLSASVVMFPPLVYLLQEVCSRMGLRSGPALHDRVVAMKGNTQSIPMLRCVKGRRSACVCVFVDPVVGTCLYASVLYMCLNACVYTLMVCKRVPVCAWWS